MDKIKQFQKITDIKPQYKKLTHPFHKTSITKIKFFTKEYELQYNDIGVWEDTDVDVTQKIKGGYDHTSDQNFDLMDIIIVANMDF